MSGFMIVPRPKVLVSYYGYGDLTGDWYAQPDAFYNSLGAISDEEALSAVGTAQISEPDLPSSLARIRYYHWTRQRGSWPTHVTGKHPLTDLAAFTPWCPLQNIHAEWPPTLLIHGTADTDVPFEQSVMMLDALTAAGASAKLITLAGAPHVFDRGITLADLTTTPPTAVAQACVESVAFLARRLTA